MFRSAVLALIAEYKPSGPPVFGAVRDLLGTGTLSQDDPDTVGRSLVRHQKRMKQESEKRKKAMSKKRGHGAGTIKRAAKTPGGCATA